MPSPVGSTLYTLTKDPSPQFWSELNREEQTVSIAIIELEAFE